MGTPFEVVWLNEREARANGVPIRYVDRDYDANKTTASEIIVLKPKSSFDRYRDIVGAEPKSVLELGVFEGGGAVGLAGLWPNAKIAGIDIRAPNPALDAHLANFGLKDRVRLHYGVSQDDAPALQHIIGASFADGIDFVVDDASHYYEHSRRSFEIVFPYVKPGGLYVLEDWGWADWQDWQDGKNVFADKKALSNLAFEFVMLAGSSPQLVESVHVTWGFVAVRRGYNKQSLQSPMKLEEHYFSRGKKLNPI